MEIELKITCEWRSCEWSRTYTLDINPNNKVDFITGLAHDELADHHSDTRKENPIGHDIYSANLLDQTEYGEITVHGEWVVFRKRN